MKERVATIKKTFDAKADADAMKAELEARAYEVVIREYNEPAVDLDNYYAELTAEKRWLVDVDEAAERRAAGEEERKLARASLAFKVALGVFVLLVLILLIWLFGPHFMTACRVVF